MNNGADALAKMNYATYVRSGDIYCLFYELAYKLLKKNGMLAYGNTAQSPQIRN